MANKSNKDVPFTKINNLQELLGDSKVFQPKRSWPEIVLVDKLSNKGIFVFVKEVKSKRLALKTKQKVTLMLLVRLGVSCYLHNKKTGAAVLLTKKSDELKLTKKEEKKL